MSTEALEPPPVWAPAACTLPTADRPLRVAEFDELFAESLRGIERPDPTTARMDLEPTPEVAARAANLVVRETGCCSFFTFALVATGGALRLEITVPATQSDVLADGVDLRDRVGGVQTCRSRWLSQASRWTFATASHPLCVIDPTMVTCGSSCETPRAWAPTVDEQSWAVHRALAKAGCTQAGLNP